MFSVTATINDTIKIINKLTFKKNLLDLVNEFQFDQKSAKMIETPENWKIDDVDYHGEEQKSERPHHLFHLAMWLIPSLRYVSY